jgi:anti-anti-sigma factor
LTAIFLLSKLPTHRRNYLIFKRLTVMEVGAGVWCPMCIHIRRKQIQQLVIQMITASVENFEQATIVRCTGKILSAEDYALLRSILVARNGSVFVVDLENVLRVDASGLGALVSLHKLATEKGGRVVIAQTNTSVRKMLALTRLDSVFETVDLPASCERLSGEFRSQLATAPTMNALAVAHA